MSTTRAVFALACLSLMACGSSSRPVSARDGGARDGSLPGDGGSRSDGSVVGDGGTTTCGAGEQYFYPGCGGSEGDVVITEGCYRPCEGPDDDSCPGELVCQRSNIDPCVCPPEPGVGCCGACGAEQWLCLARSGPYPLTSLDEVCEGTVSGQQILDTARLEHTATFTYREGPTTPLTLSLAYDGGELRCHPQIDPPPGSDAPSIGAHLQVDVTLGFVTDDGAFSESLEATLDAFGTTSATLSARMDADALVGSYDATIEDVTDVGLSFGGLFDGAGTTGAVYQGGTSSGGVGVSEPVGQWATD